MLAVRYQRCASVSHCPIHLSIHTSHFTRFTVHMTQSLQTISDDAVAPQRWDQFVADHPQSHILQTSGWGELKSQFGWSSERLALVDEQGTIRAGCLLLYRRVAGLTLAYASKGPLTDWSDRSLTGQLLDAMETACKEWGAAFLKVEPDLPDTAQNRALLAEYGFRPSAHTIQPRSTVVLDIAGEEHEILARMKSKWRYNVRLSKRKGVVVRAGSRADLHLFQKLMRVTGQRDDFAVHSADYYATAYDLFVPEQAAYLFAEYEGEPLASIVIFLMGKTAWYLWGASSNRHRNRMPNHALQWAAIQWARERGATGYDLWGIPDEIGQIALGMQRRGGEVIPAEEMPVDVGAFPAGDLWGVFRFKQGFGGCVARFVGAWDLPYNRPAYAAYRLGTTALRKRDELGDWESVARQFLTQTVETAQKKIPDLSLSNGSTPSPLQPVSDPESWRAVLAELPDPHVLQSWEWGEMKSQTGWQAERLVLPGASGQPRAAFQFLWRQPLEQFPLRVAYVPKGPLLDWQNRELMDEVLSLVEQHARRRGCIFVKIDPNVREDSPAGRLLVATLWRRGWHYSDEQIQFKNTAFTDLTADEETLLADMKSKWRYNTRLARRRGVAARISQPEQRQADLAAFYRLYAETGGRDGFLIRPFAYYETIWRTFLDAQCHEANPAGGALLLAEHPDDPEPVAGLFLLRYGRRAWYFYGASSDRHRRDMPNYLLQWRAMQWAKSQGCTVYDWWGAPTDPDDPDDPMQGVWRFKQGFGAEFQPHIGAWDRPLSHLLYSVYTEAMPRLLAWKRQIQE